MAKKFGELDENSLQDIQQSAIGTVNTLDQIGKSIAESLKTVSKLTGESTQGYKENFSAGKKLAEEIAKVDAATLSSRKQQAVFQDKVRKATEEATKLEARAGRLRLEATNLTKAQAREAYKVARAYEDGADHLRQQASDAQVLVEQFDKLNSKTTFFDNLADLTRAIPGMSQLFGEFQKASDAAREAAAEGGNSFRAGARQLVAGLTKTLSIFTVGAIFSGLKSFDERTVSLGRNLNKTREESDKLVQSFNNAGRNIIGLTGADLQNAAQGYSETLGSAGIVSEITSKTLATQVKYLGMSSEEANNLLNYSQATGKEYTNFTNTIIGEVKLSNQRNKTGVLYQKVLKDIANTSNTTKLLMDRQGRSLGQAGIEAQKLGATIDQIAVAGKNMLNFEESIAAELEAELISGKEINNEKARAAALTGDQQKLMEALKEDQALQKFEAAKTVVEQESIAKAYGMQSSEMADMLVKSKAMSALKADDQKDLQKNYSAEIAKIDALKAQGKVMEANKLQQELSSKIGSDELERQLHNTTLMEKQEELMTSIKETFGILHKILQPIGMLFDAMQKNVSLIAKALGLILASKSISRVQDMVGNLSKKSLTNTTASTAKEATEALSNTKAGGAVGNFFKGLGSKITGSTAGQFAGKAFNKAGAMVGSLNPLKAAGSWVSKNAGKLLKAPLISTLLEAYFAKNDIQGMISTATDKNTLYQQIGTRSWQALGSIGGAALGTLIPVPGLGSILGGLAGGWLSGLLADAIGAEGMGKFVLDNIFEDEKKNAPIPLATGGITTGPTRALIGEAGQEAVIPLREFYAKIDELITAVKAGGNIYIGPHKLNEAIGLNLHSIS